MVKKITRLHNLSVHQPAFLFKFCFEKRNLRPSNPRKKNLSKLCLTVKNKTETGGFDCQRSIYVTNSQSFEYPIYTLETTLISRVIIERKKKKKKRTTNERVNKIDPV